MTRALVVRAAGRYRRTAAGLLGMLLVLLGSNVTAAVSATVEPRVVDEFDTVRLTIRATGSNQAERLDLAALETDFEVLTTQSTSQYRSVNGQVESWVEYTILLRPLSTGDLTVPPIEVGGAVTEALPVRVRGMDPALRQAIDRMVFFETELTRDPVYVQAQTVLVRRLYYASGAQIYSDLPGMPEVPDAIVMPLGETTSTTTIREGQRYGVIEQRFAILPEQSGTLNIPSIAVTSSVRLEVDGRTRRSGVRVATEPLALEVRPIPPDYPADHPWLPAESVTVDDQWEGTEGGIVVGDPLRRTVRARIQGNVSSAIPPLRPALPDEHFRRYPEPPELTDDDSGSSVRGLREEAFAIIPTAPGTVHLPATEIVWWDVDAERVRTARAAGRTLAITGTATTNADGTAGPAGDEAHSAESSTEPSAESSAEPSAESNSVVPADVADQEPRWEGHARTRSIWIALLLAALAGAALAWLLPGLQAGWQRWRPDWWPDWWPAGESERVRRRALAAACRRGEPAAIHRQLLAYLRSHYRAPLGEAIRRFRADGYASVLDQVNAACYYPGVYHPEHDKPVDTRRVMAAVQALGRATADRPAGTLPGLYE